MFNEIDYLIIQTKRKFSMIDARSYQTFSVNTDHRLVITKLRIKTDWERGRSKPAHRGEDPIMEELRVKRAINKEKISNTKDDEKD